jgi:hypothetical protein
MMREIGGIAMKRFVIAAGLLALAACASGPPTGFDNIASIPSQIDQRGVSFGIGRIPGEDALALKVHFKISATGEEEGDPVTEADWMEAAKAAAPKGCTVKKLTPTEDGGRKAEYQC